MVAFSQKKILGGGLSIELFAMMEVFCAFTIQYSNPKSLSFPGI